MKNIIISAAIVSTMLVSCSNEENAAFQTSKEKNELGVLVGINTRSSINGTAFPAKSEIGVFIAGTGYTSVVSKFVCPDNTANPWTPNNKIFLNNNTADVYGFYPSGITPDLANKTVSVKVLGSQNGLPTPGATPDQDDLMYAVSTGKVSNAVGNDNATLIFKHALAKLSFSVTKGTYNGTGNITGIELTSASSKLLAGDAGVMKLVDGSISGLSKATSLKLVAAQLLSASPSVLPTGLVAPVANLDQTPDIKIIVTVDNKPMSIALPVTTIKAWEAGKIYTYTITVNGTELSINNTVTVTDWLSGGADTSAVIN